MDPILLVDTPSFEQNSSYRYDSPGSKEGRVLTLDFLTICRPAAQIGIDLVRGYDEGYSDSKKRHIKNAIIELLRRISSKFNVKPEFVIKSLTDLIAPISAAIEVCTVSDENRDLFIVLFGILKTQGEPGYWAELLATHLSSRAAHRVIAEYKTNSTDQSVRDAAVQSEIELALVNAVQTSVQFRRPFRLKLFRLANVVLYRLPRADHLPYLFRQIPSEFIQDLLLFYFSNQPEFRSFSLVKTIPERAKSVVNPYSYIFRTNQSISRYWVSCELRGPGIPVGIPLAFGFNSPHVEGRFLNSVYRELNDKIKAIQLGSTAYQLGGKHLFYE